MNLNEALTILSAMITPAVLIVASGSLILTTSQRLSRSVERVRTLSDQLRKLIMHPEESNWFEDEHNILVELIHYASRRSRLLQQSLTILYITLGTFVAISITIGILEFSGMQHTWVLTLLTVLGAGFLFYASILLIVESQIAFRAVNYEMNTVLNRVKRYKKSKAD
ncbi:DUF2721 domain-containing protein [Adhaeribacter radiodurans]|uniref:DUF2721 domain-containing protein n=1 Tax=Adhaeribacter radiodurans TaxID=2745197 RepID=A0A7L7LDF1_9BACT|nr:DUF2721 domain-containing protein [Adhaeribacter radiodurans]QMU30872.1 DUF2721 domain-containing protein [Adhaeribacter radiodurans]